MNLYQNHWEQHIAKLDPVLWLKFHDLVQYSTGSGLNSTPIFWIYNVEKLPLPLPQVNFPSESIFFVTTGKGSEFRPMLITYWPLSSEGSLSCHICFAQDLVSILPFPKDHPLQQVPRLYSYGLYFCNNIKLVDFSFNFPFNQKNWPSFAFVRFEPASQGRG